MAASASHSLPAGKNGNEPLHIYIADALAHQILDDSWAPGSSVTLEEIQTRFSISRTVAREATRLLTSLGCAQFQRGTGVIACPPEHWDDLNSRVISWKLHSSYRKDELRALTELRLAVEPAAAAGCAVRGSIEARTRVAVIGHDMIKAVRESRLDDFHDLDVDFHTSILLHSGNPLFAELSSSVESVLRGRVEINMYPQQPEESALNAHEQVYRAVLNGDGSAAHNAMLDIVNEVNSALGLSAI